jgi:cytochrome c biogenesis protein CcmG/thiol:disulfide interchange protein DsbE
VSDAVEYLDEDGDEAPGGGRRRLVIAGIAAVLVLAVIALLVVGLVNNGVGSRIDDALAAGERPEAPGFTLPLLTDDPDLGPAGTEVSLTDLEGRPVVLNFWASWCDPCREEAPILEEVWRDYRGRGVVVLGIDTQDLSENAIAFLDETATTYPSVRDGSSRAEKDYETTGVPETFLIDQDGRIALRFVGQVTEAEQITNALDQVMA